MSESRKTETESSPHAKYRPDVELVKLLITEVVVGVRLLSSPAPPSMGFCLLSGYFSSLFTPSSFTFTAHLPIRTSHVHAMVEASIDEGWIKVATPEMMIKDLLHSLRCERELHGGSLCPDNSEVL